MQQGGDEVEESVCSKEVCTRIHMQVCQHTHDLTTADMCLCVRACWYLCACVCLCVCVCVYWLAIVCLCVYVCVCVQSVCVGRADSGGGEKAKCHVADCAYDAKQVPSCRDTSMVPSCR